MSVPEPLIIGILVHLATIFVGSGFVRRLAIENLAAYAEAGSPTVAQVVWSKWPPMRYVYFILSRRFAALLHGTNLRRDGEVLFALYSLQMICMLWFALILFL